ncbi:MAG: hypothetical protein ACXABY_23975, partial [Candidatus Thorarchaeota archaeon]
MTLQEAIDNTRVLARDDTIATSTIVEHLNEGVAEFANSIHGLDAESYLRVIPKFDTDVMMAFRVITNAVSATISLLAQTDATGTTIATDIDTQLAGAGVTGTTIWSTTTWTFSISIPTATSFQIASPSDDSTYYTDAIPTLFGGGSTVASATWLGGFPEDCTVMTEMPSDFMSVRYVEWDNNPLTPAPFDMFLSPELRGRPSHYAVKNKELWLYPVPSEQKELHVWYKAKPATMTTASASAASLTFGAEYNYGPVYYAVATMYDTYGENKQADRFHARYLKKKAAFNITYGNQNTTVFP